MSNVNLDLLKAIGAAAAAGQLFYIGVADGRPLVEHNPPLIQVNGNQKDPSDESKIACVLTEAGGRMAAGQSRPQQSNGAAQPSGSKFQVTTGFVAPKIKRGGGFGGGAPTKYPFDDMEVGASFFVADTEVESGNALKTLSSAVGSANQRWAKPTGEKKTVTRAKRGDGNKAMLNPDGSKVMETVEVDVKKSERKFGARPVEANVKYGDWTAPANGAVAFRAQ